MKVVELNQNEMMEFDGGRANYIDMLKRGSAKLRKRNKKVYRWIGFEAVRQTIGTLPMWLLLKED